MINTYSFVWIVAQALTQKVKAFFTNLNILRNLYIACINIFYKLSLVSTSEWGLSEESLVKSNSKAPYIYLMVIELIVENLRSHIKRSATVKFDHFILAKSSSEAKIS